MTTKPQTRPLGAQISHMLKTRGVDTIFGIPGVHNVEMYRGIEEAGIAHILARHEQGAGFMADGYARATGRPGVAYVITGPGLTNIMTPMGQAYSDSVPMLVISSCLDETAARKGQLHQMKDQRAAAETVCDWSEEAKTAEAAYQLIDRAFVEFATMRPRPKHVQISIESLKRPATACTRVVPHRGDHARPLLQQVAAIRDGLIRARKPLFIFGGGTRQGQLYISDKWKNGVREVVKYCGAASFTTHAGRGLLPDDAPLHFGCSLSNAASAEIIRSADYVVAVGTELAEVDLWRSELGHNSTFVRVDIDPMVLSDAQNATISVQSDSAAFIEPLADLLKEGGGVSDWDPGEVAAYRTRCRAETDAARPGIVPICDALREALPDDTMIYSDMTQFAYVAKEVWPMTHPGHWHHPYGFGTLGYALPAAIGGKIGVGEKPVVAIAGDYGFHYTMQELGVAVELGLTLPIILWDNGKLKEIEDCMVRSQIAPNAVVAQNPDFCKLAEAFGAASAAPNTLTEMQEAVKAALATAGPTLIYVTPEILG